MNLNMSRLVVVSNRLPISVQKRKGTCCFEPTVSGVVTTLKWICNCYHSIWIGWPGIECEAIKGEENDIKLRLLSEECHPIFLTQCDVDSFHHGFCNSTIWPLFHHLSMYAIYDKDLWYAYKRVNKTFSNMVIKIAKPSDTIWIHDYQLMLLPKLTRERLPEVKMGFFLHIPFPPFEILRLLPWSRQILGALMGADLIGFHTSEYAHNFIDAVKRLLCCQVCRNQINVANRVVKLDVFPLGIDYEKYSRAHSEPEVQAEICRLNQKLGNCRIILSLDRQDYTKGICQRLEAFSLFLERRPDQHRKIIMILVVIPSAIRARPYKRLKVQIDELVKAINDKYSSSGWTPVDYLYKSLPFHSYAALYNVADIALVTPLRDGMNLVAKEYIAAKADNKGVLILSETCGAAKELGEAIIINVDKKEEIVNALEKALAMPEEERIQRSLLMKEHLQHYSVERWASEYMIRLLGQDLKVYNSAGFRY